MEYEISRNFYDKYKSLHDHLALVTMKNGEQFEGSYCDDFFEDESVMIGYDTIKIADIEKMELSPKDQLPVCL